jgi:hypothetical protein
MSETEIPNQGKLIINAHGLGALKTVVYSAGMPKERTQPFPTKKNTNNPQLPQGKQKDAGLDSKGINVGDAFYLGGLVFSNLDFAGYEIKYNTVLFDVSMDKNVIATKLQGHDGTVKEYISDDDYMVTIKGVINGTNGFFPIQAAKQLIKVCKYKGALAINSSYLNEIFGIYNLVIIGYNVPQIEAGQSKFPFTITCLSDSPIELTISK